MKKARCHVGNALFRLYSKSRLQNRTELNSKKASLAKSAKIINKGQMYSFQKKTAKSMQYIYHCHGFRCDHNMNLAINLTGNICTLWR